MLKCKKYNENRVIKFKKYGVSIYFYQLDYSSVHAQVHQK